MENLPLEIYDIIMLVVLVLMTIAGAYWGLAWQVASLASLGLSWVVAMRFGPQVAPIFAGDKEPTFWHNCTAILVIYLGTSLAIWIVFRLISKIIARVKLKEFDRQTGAMLGLANGVALCLVITFFAVTLSEQARQAVLRSRSGYYAAVIVERVSPAIPEDVRKVLGKYIEELDRKLDPDTPAEESVLDESISASIQLPRDQTPTGAGGASDVPSAVPSAPLAIEPPVSGAFPALREQAETLGANLPSPHDLEIEVPLFAPNSEFKLPQEPAATLEALREEFSVEVE